MKKLNTKEFIERAKIIHNDKYDYSKVKYINNRTKVCIVCPKHGEFWQQAASHLKGIGCKKCAYEIKTKNIILSTEEFIVKAKKIHGNKYDYSKVDYKNNSTKVCIVCPKHGEFWQEPNVHLGGSGCKKCYFERLSLMKTFSVQEFIEKARKIHGEKYDYSKVVYNGSNTKVCIICPIHGEFWQTPVEHLRKSGCPKCGGTKKLTTEEFIKRAKEVHGDKYDYSKAVYINCHTKVCIICPIHGEFWQTPNMHLLGQGCKNCSNINNGLKKRKTKEQFIEEAKKIHGNKYDYSKVEYVNNSTEVCIICPIHGEFWQTPYLHLKGNGCKKCNISLLENDLIELFKNENIPYIFRERSLPWLKGLELDFYILEYKLAIECQGIQHFVNKHFFEPLEVVQERDGRKRKLCEENEIKLLYYSNLGIKYPYKVFENKEELLKEIKNGRK